MELQKASDATLLVTFSLVAVEGETCDHTLVNVDLETFRDKKIGTGAGGQLYPSQYPIRPAGLKCYPDHSQEMFCEFEGDPIDCEEKEITGI